VLSIMLRLMAPSHSSAKKPLNISANYSYCFEVYCVSLLRLFT